MPNRTRRRARHTRCAHLCDVVTCSARAGAPVRIDFVDSVETYKFCGIHEAQIIADLGLAP